jgi:hypothetical protein
MELSPIYKCEREYIVMKKSTKIIVTLFGGWFGLHRYLNHQIGLGILYTLTGGLFCIGWMIDLFLACISPGTSSNTDSSGNSQPQLNTPPVGYSTPVNAQPVNVRICPKCSCEYNGNFCPMCGTAFNSSVASDVKSTVAPPEEEPLRYPHRKEKRFAYSLFSDENNILWMAKYTYDNVDIYRMDTSFTELMVYDDVELVLEPTNSYDPNAVAVIFCGNRIGYLYKGARQDMVHDYYDNGDLVKAQIQSIDGNKITLKIFFCKKRSSLLPPKDLFTVKLVSNSREEWQDNISCCSEDASLDIEYDSDKDKYLVTDSGLEIGYIPSSKTDKLQPLEDDGYMLFGEVQDIHMDDSGKYSISISVTAQ